MTPLPPVYSELSYLDAFAPRGELLEGIRRKQRFDVVIVGGGIHGAALARVAALNNLSVLLLEQEDYAFGSSSRSSRMIHGGLRYLEFFDLAQVFGGIRAREELLERAPHIVKPQAFFIPMPKGERFLRWKLGAGLTLYDLFVRKVQRKHVWVDTHDAPFPPAAFGSLAGWYRYTDGLTNDAQLTLDFIHAARQEGALCVNHAIVDRVVGKLPNLAVGWTDRLTGTSYETPCGIVVNCAGPWAARLSPDLRDQLLFSQGSLLLFRKVWRYPALLLPLPGRSRYYFVWPHPQGTLVGTTEHPLQDLPYDPLPTSGELGELMQRVSRDLSWTGLLPSDVQHAFAGVRTFIGRRGSNTATLSRHQEWRYVNGVLTLIGGKLTTALSTAYDGLREIFRVADLDQRVRPQPLNLSGSVRFDESVGRFLSACESRSIPEVVALSAVRRLGGRVRLFEERGLSMEMVAGTVLKGEVELAIDEAQAESVDDLMRRRLDLEGALEHGLPALPAIAEILKGRRPQLDVASQIAGYTARMGQVDALIRGIAAPPTAPR